MNLPIIYSPHRIGLKNNTLDYLFVPLSISSVIKSNPNSDVYFLNVNENYPITAPGLTNVDTRPFYDESCEVIRRVYKHLSTNKPEFELFCLERFFVLREFMKARKIEKAFIVETDVLVFEDLSTLFKPDIDAETKAYLSEQKCISLAYITLEYIDYYCSYVIECYSNPIKLEEITAFYQRYIDKGGKGGICDMTFCDYINKGMYSADSRYKAKNFSILYNFNEKSYHLDSFIGYDNILAKEGFLFDMTKSYIDGKVIKDIKFQDGRPFVESTEGKIWLGSVHCQGNAKALMSDYYTNAFSQISAR